MTPPDRGRVYLIICKPLDRAYVGATILSLEQRWGGHVSAAFRRDSKASLPMAIRKYGEAAFSFRVLEECDVSILGEREAHWIKALDTYKNGFNDAFKSHRYTQDGTAGVRISRAGLTTKKARMAFVARRAGIRVATLDRIYPQLSVEHRRVLRLRFLSRSIRTYEQIGRVLGLSAESVRSLLAAAIRQLRTIAGRPREKTRRVLGPVEQKGMWFHKARG